MFSAEVARYFTGALSPRTSAPGSAILQLSFNGRNSMLSAMSSLVWIELSGRAPDHNAREIKACAGKEVRLCAVVKSNAYGHGMAQMVKLLPSADWFAVNSLEEGLELRELGVRKPVLLLGHVPLERLHQAVEADLRLTVYNRETLDTLSRIHLPLKPVRLHLKIETGTARQGIPIEEITSFVERMDRIEGVELEGLSTHFANIEDTLNHDYSEYQLEGFSRALQVLGDMGYTPPIIHTASTAAAILFPKTHFHMLRAGIGLYGLWPSRETFISARMGHRKVPDLRPVLAWKTKVAQLKTLPEGSFVGYGCTYRTTRRTRIAVLPVGYADGYDRKLGNNAYVLVNGKRAPVIGRVCMNLTMIDVTDIERVSLENEVVLLGTWDGETISAETLAGWASTINYEIVTRISPALQRRIV
jgi:alanine racemase